MSKLPGDTDEYAETICHTANNVPGKECTKEERNLQMHWKQNLIDICERVHICQL
jgi:hypothetical protein